MNWKKYLLAAIAVFVAYSVLGAIIHEGLLSAEYAPLKGTVLRVDAAFSQRLPAVYLGNLLFALAFCLIYAKGYEPAKGWIGQGLRFGLLVGLLLVPFALLAYAIFPVTAALTAKWLVFGYLQVILTALVAAGLYKP